MNIIEVIFKDNPTPGGGARRVPRGWVIIAVLGVTFCAIAYYGALGTSRRTSEQSHISDPVRANASQIISQNPEEAKSKEAAAKQDVKRKKMETERSLKHAITTEEQAKEQREAEAKQAPIQFDRSTQSLGESTDDTSLGATQSKRADQDAPFWERVQKNGIAKGMDAAPNKQGINPTADLESNDPLGKDASGQKISKSGSPNKPPTAEGTDAFASYIAYTKSPDLGNSLDDSDDTTEHFLPAGTLIPVTFVTGVNTSQRLSRTGGGSTTPVPATSTGAAVPSSTDQGSGGGGLQDSLIIVQIARPVVSQHRLQLTTKTRILCNIENDALTEDEDVSRVFLRGTRVLFADGSELSLSGASFYDARDKERGVLAQRVVPPLWKRLLPIAVAKFGAGVLQASSGTYQVTQSPTGGTIQTKITGGVTDAMKSGAADTVNFLSDTYLTRILDENQPYSRITPGAIAFIMLENPVDITVAKRGVSHKKLHLHNAAPTTPIVPNPTDAIDSLLNKYRNQLDKVTAKPDKPAL